ncbi:ribosomal protein S16 domain-containing protein [Syncephalis plumigaleata]|nr:ribosomal protein S16 domain-containing protein [Syncephalis plumigaleata]
MPLRIRLQRLGPRNLPTYRMVVANARAPRDGKHIERLGVYNPRPDSDGIKHITMNMNAVGAQPTERVEKILANVSWFGTRTKKTYLSSSNNKIKTEVASEPKDATA